MNEIKIWAFTALKWKICDQLAAMMALPSTQDAMVTTRIITFLVWDPPINHHFPFGGRSYVAVCKWSINRSWSHVSRSSNAPFISSWDKACWHLRCNLGQTLGDSVAQTLGEQLGAAWLCLSMRPVTIPSIWSLTCVLSMVEIQFKTYHLMNGSEFRSTCSENSKHHWQVCYAIASSGGFQKVCQNYHTADKQNPALLDMLLLF